MLRCGTQILRHDALIPRQLKTKLQTRNRVDQTFLAHPQISKGDRLFGYPEINSPTSLSSLGQRTVRRADLVVNRICRLPAQFTRKGTRKEDALLIAAKQFDRLSDLLCSVIDTCEFLRNVHADQDWISSANETYEYMCGYMNTLNTHVGLYQTLYEILEPFRNTTIPPSLYAAHQVSVQFLRDFEKSGIHLPDVQRDQFVTLTDQTMLLCRELISPDDVSTRISLNAAEAGTVHSGAGVEKVGKRTYLDASSHTASHLLRASPVASLRRKIWIAHNAASVDRVNCLEQLLQTRSQIADLLAKQSYAHVALEDKMVRDPKLVDAFLASLSQKIRPRAAEEVELMRRASQLDVVAPWDREYAQARAFSTLNLGTPTSITAYLSISQAISGLSKLFTRLFGVCLQPTTPDQTEIIWDPLVQKVQVVDEDGCILGHMYLDLIRRVGKPVGAAHYTVRCSRRTDDDDAEADFEHSTAADDELRHVIQPGAISRTGKSGTWQTPIIVLSCDFNAEQGLEWSEVQTLFHEMGHAIHSMLGQTPYQNVSGTRCATDMVELPSILMEHFCASPDVLPLFTSHFSTGKPLPPEMLHQHLKAQDAFKALEETTQIIFAALDQTYHSLQVARPGWSCRTSWYDTLSEFGPPTLYEGEARLLLEDSETCWPARFTHLTGYGATYYSYLLDRAIAAQVWSTAFQDSGGLSRSAGQRYRDHILQHGGSRDPWLCIGEFLRDAEISDGGPRALQKIGSWLN